MAVVTQKEKVKSLPLKIQVNTGIARQSEGVIPPITINPERMGGTPVIGIERLPVEFLVGYLVKGGTVDEFVDEFSADREKVMAALQLIRESLADGWLAERVNY